MQYLIVGTGPVGVVTAEYLLNQNKKVIIVDNSSTKKSKKTNYIFKYTDEEIFSNNIYCDSKKTNFLPVSSAIEGGFTKIWGGTFSELQDADFKNWDINRNELNNFFLYLIKLLDLNVDIDDNFNLISNSNNYDLGVDEFCNKKNYKNLFIQKSKIMEKDGVVWSSDVLLSKLLTKYPETQYINNLEVTNISENEEEVVLHSKDRAVSFANTSVLVCAGALSSSLIGSNILKIPEFTIMNSDLHVMPIINMGKTFGKSEIKFPQIFIDIIDKNIKSQIYVVNRNLLSTIDKERSVFSTLLLKFASKLLGSRLLMIFIYTNSENSDYFEFINEDNQISIKAVKKEN